MSADEMCGDYPAPCNCDDPETHDGAVTAADRPSVTDNARAEAERRWPRLYGPEETLTYPREAVREHTRAGFMAGAEWAAGRAETTTATDEDVRTEVERLLLRHGHIEWTEHDARTVAEVLDAAGLLATARTRPTRDELAKVICESRCSPQRKSWLETADAVLALLRDGA